VALNGGKTTGVFQNRSDLCLRGSSGSKFNPVNAVAKLDGWNGKSSGDKTIAAQVLGCGPGVSGQLSRASGESPSLTVTVQKHPNAPNVKELELTLGRNLALVRSRLGSGASGTASAELGSGSFTYVSRRQLKVSGLPSAGAGEVTIRLRSGAIRVSRRSRRLLEAGRSRRFRIKVKQTPISGAATSTRGAFRARAKRR
jgi:hypothetical protein